MKFAGIIAEYDPFHNGHAWQLAQARALGAQRMAVAMSCGLTQRGALPLLPEAVRVQAALACGADLVFALPAPCACAGAEAFARAGVRILAAAGCDALVFGAENPDTALLQKAARVLCSEAYRTALRQQLAAGARSFAAARQAAVQALCPGADIAALLDKPNNNLAVEYCKAIIEQNVEMQPIALPRQGDGLHFYILFYDGFTILYGKIIVGLVQQCGDVCPRAQRLHRRLPGGGKAARPSGKLLPERGAVCFAAQHPGSFLQQGGVRVLCPKDQRIAPGSGQNAHPRPGKSLGTGAGAGRGQGKHKVCSAGQRRLHPHRLRQQRQRPPLGKPAAHGYGHPLRPQRPCLCQLPCVAVVEGVVLRNDACKLHGTAPFRQKIVKIISDIQKNPAVSGICGQDIQKPCTQVLPLCPGCALKSRHTYYIINIGICKILSAGF